MNDTNPARAYLDGKLATVADLTPLAFAGFAHFTAMQVRNGRVKGLDLHLGRLRSASMSLYGHALSDARVLECLRIAIADGPVSVSLVATIFSRAGEFTDADEPGDPALLVRTGPPSNGPQRDLRLALVEHERWLPEIKHVGETAKTRFLRQAIRDGFDDAAFIDRSGRISEATIWNLAFWNGEAVIWPEADMLPGVTMQIVRRQLDRLGIAQISEPITMQNAARFSGAAVMNSWTPGVAVTAVGDMMLSASQPLVRLLHQAYEQEEATAI